MAEEVGGAAAGLDVVGVHVGVGEFSAGAGRPVDQGRAAHGPFGCPRATPGCPGRRGELVCAVVEQPPGTGFLTLDAVTAFLRAEDAAVHRLPERLEPVDALPRDEALRKVLTYKRRERYSGTVK